MFKLIVSALSLVLLLSSTPVSIASDIVASPLIVQIVDDIHPVATADGSVHLVYELLVVNQGMFVVTLDEISVIDGGSGAALKTLADSELASASRLTILGGDGVVLQPSQSSFVFVDAAISADAIPAELVTRITATQTALEGTTANHGGLTTKPDPGLSPTVTFETAAVEIGAPAIELISPVRGENWIIFRGCCDLATSHRGGINAYNGEIHVTERFAVDLVQMDASGLILTGPGNEVESYVHHGQPLYAVADGTIVSARNDQPAQVPGALPTGMPPSLAGGNAVVIDIGGGAFAFYAHMQAGSVSVKVGDHVTAGDPIGLIGNSGMSLGPHFHFHVSTSPGNGGDGLPFVFTDFIGQGVLSRDALMMALQGQSASVLTDVFAGPHSREMPLNNQVVDFGGE